MWSILPATATNRTQIASANTMHTDAGENVGLGQLDARYLRDEVEVPFGPKGTARESQTIVICNLNELV